VAADAQQRHALLGLNSPADALALLGLLRSAAAEFLSSFELMPRIASSSRRVTSKACATRSHILPWYILCELTSAGAAELDALLQETLALALERSRCSMRCSPPASAFAGVSGICASTFRRRSGARDRVSKRHLGAGGVVTRFHPRGIAMGQRARAGGYCGYGHAGDGNLHFNINRIESSPDAAFWRASRTSAVPSRPGRELHGSISAEHGIGRLKREELQRYAAPAALTAMRASSRRSTRTAS